MLRLEPETQSAVGIETGATGFRYDLQGLRGVAILSVLLYHANVAVFSGGFVGVDIFFVLSGFLISKTIKADLDLQRFSLADYYRKRIRRIVPALATMLLAVALAGLCILPPKNLRELGINLCAGAFFASNFSALHFTNYFEASAEYQPLLHTRSLEVEEQFYLLFPIVLARISLKRTLAIKPILLGMLLASLSLSVWLSSSHPSIAFYLVPTRAFELLLGASVALKFYPEMGRMMQEGLAVVGLAGLGISIFVLNDRVLFPSYAALLPCGACGLLILCGAGQAAFSKVLAIKPLTYFGNIPYSLYLWHWPVLVFARYLLLRDLRLEETYLCLGV